MRRSEVAATEELHLRLFGPVRGNQWGVRGCQSEAPASGRVAAGDFDDDLEEGRVVELVAAEHLGLQQAIEARLDELIVQGL